MSKDKISDYSETPGNNTDIGGINIAEGMLPSDVNNAIREQMAQLKKFQSGASGESVTFATVNATTISASNINKVTVTAPVTGSTLTIADGKTLTANNSLTLAGTDATTMTFPSTSATIARTDAGQTFTGTQVMTSPRIVTSINDTNGNEVFRITATGSAVNELTVANAATGNNPTISATGSDTNIGITLTPKGTGGVVFPAGAVGTPAITTSGDTNTGIFFPAADQVAITTNGVERVEFGNSATVFNDGGANVDFRVEGDTNANLLFVDASADKVGIGTNAPAVLVHVQSTTATTNAVTQVLRIDSQSSGTPANGIGVGMQFATETAAGNTEIGATIEAITTDVTGTSEDFDLSFKTMAAGAAAAERFRAKSTGDFQFNSGYGSVATAYGCRAWVNFDGTGTPAIRASGNVSSITDNGTGDYTVNFTTAMADANYCVSGAGGGTVGNFNNSVSVGNYLAAPSTTAVRVVTIYGTTISDCGQANVAIFR